MKTNIPAKMKRENKRCKAQGIEIAHTFDAQCSHDECLGDCKMHKRPEPQHTPTPWYRNVSPAWKYPIYADKNGNPDGRDWIHVAAVLSGNPNAEADLDLIVKAVNNYESDQKKIKALVEALKLSVLRLKEFGEQQKKSRIDLTSDLEKTIALAEGR